jgi:nucleotide-binding universal stress UspA family protein
MYRRILVPLDGSPEAESALPHALVIATGLGASVTLLHAAEAPNRTILSTLEAIRVLEDEQRAASQYLRDVAQLWAARASAVLLAVQVSGPVARAIVDYAWRVDADVIVMASRRRGAVTRLLEGSVAEAVARAAPCPVLIVPPGGGLGGSASPNPNKRLIRT